MSFSSFWKNPENNSLKTLVVVGAVGVAGVFAFTFAHINPFALTGRIFDSLFGYGYGTSIVPPTVMTYPVVTSPSLILNGDITSTGGATVTHRGFIYSTTAIVFGCETGTAFSTTTGASCATNFLVSDTGSSFPTGPYNRMIFPDPAPGCYNVRAWATNSAGTSYGLSVPFMWYTPSCGSTTGTPPTVTTNTAVISGPTIIFYGVLNTLGSATPATLTFNYGTATSGVYTTAVTTPITPASSGTAGTLFKTGVPLSTFTCGVNYNYVAKATTTAGTGIGLPSAFMIGCPGFPPAVTTIGATVGTGSVTLSGKMTSLGSASPATLGFTYGTVTSGVYTTPVTTFVSPATSSTPASFTAMVAGLTCGTNYKFLANATTTAGTGSGALVPFTTTPCVVTSTPPTVTTTTSSVLSGTSATINGTLNTMGSASPATLSFLYGTVASGVFGTATGVGLTAPATSTTAPMAFHATLTGLTCGTAYKFTAKAVTTAGSATGLLSAAFTTSPCPVLTIPHVDSISALYTSSTAIFNGDVSNMGGAPLVTVGFDWGLTTAYTGGHLTNTFPVSVPSSFSSVMVTGLICGGTTYHYRTWGSNGAGMGVGLDRTLVTPSCPSTPITVPPATAITSTGATLNGKLTAMGGWSPSPVGFDYGLTTAYGTRVSAGTKTSPGTFLLAITGLAPHTTYHWRAWSHNPTNTEYAYGVDSTLTTP